MQGFSDTIVARATPMGTAGVAVVRMSGPDAVAIAAAMFADQSGVTLDNVPPRMMAYGAITDGGVVVDHCLAVRFAAPHSFTGDDVVEWHLHGNMAITDQVTRLCLRLGARPAGAGEFTRRAFVNGRMDITQVEALADVVSVESEQALNIAQRQLHGELRRRLEEFRDRVLHLLALLELELDFVEDGYEFAAVDDVNRLIAELRAFVERLLRSYRVACSLRHGPRLLLLGRPNAGKSSLFNAMIGFGRALVSPTAGTTRDYIEERVSHGGVVFRLVDTAGLRATADSIEAAGVERARDLAGTADHVMYLIDSSRTDGIDEELMFVDELRRSYPSATLQVIATKLDAARFSVEGAIACSVYDEQSVMAILDDLVALYRQELAEVTVLVNERQQYELARIAEMLDAVDYQSLRETELLSADLRQLLDPLSALTGEVVNDDVLDRLFGSFCIGK